MKEGLLKFIIVDGVRHNGEMIDHKFLDGCLHGNSAIIKLKICLADESEAEEFVQKIKSNDEFCISSDQNIFVGRFQEMCKIVKHNITEIIFSIIGHRV